MTAKAGKKIITALICAVILYISVLGGVGLTALASSEYSNVLDDLKADESFDITKYSSNRADFETDEEFFTLRVEQIAESSAGELLIYVYNPSALIHPITAKKITISTAVIVNQKWQLYDLELLSRSDVFSKYKVKDFNVKADVVRYYDITSIYREWDSSLGDVEIAGGTTDCVAIEVAKVYTAITAGDKVSYACEGTQVITVTASYAGFLRYGAGVFGTNRCDAQFIAFSTDRQIDELIEADLTWKSQSYTFWSEYNFDFWKVITGRGEEQTQVSKTYGEEVQNERTVDSNEKASYQGDGWFAKKYTWDRIQSVDEFLANTVTNESLKNDIADMQWVLRFTETEYDFLQSSNSNGTWAYQRASGTKISEIGILRLKFKIGIDTFNLGVVCNLITGDDEPDNPYDPGIEVPGIVVPGFNFFSYVWNCCVKLFSGTADLTETIVAVAAIVVVVILIAILLQVLSIIFPIVGVVLKIIINAIWTAIKYLFIGIWIVVKYIFIGLWWFISLPFKGIAALIRKRKEQSEQITLDEEPTEQHSEPKRSLKLKSKKSRRKNEKNKGK